PVLRPGLGRKGGRRTEPGRAVQRRAAIPRAERRRVVVGSHQGLRYARGEIPGVCLGAAVGDMSGGVRDALDATATRDYNTARDRGCHLIVLVRIDRRLSSGEYQGVRDLEQRDGAASVLRDNGARDDGGGQGRRSNLIEAAKELELLQSQSAGKMSDLQRYLLKIITGRIQVLLTGMENDEL
ncbi:hypothetical protein THAOC_10265, partial [Thalassiosira oceanica]